MAFYDLNKRMYEKLEELADEIDDLDMETNFDSIRYPGFPIISVIGFERGGKEETFPLVSTKAKPLNENRPLKSYSLYDIRLEDALRYLEPDFAIDKINTIESICFVPQTKKDILLYIYGQNVAVDNPYSIRFIVEGSLTNGSHVLETSEKLIPYNSYLQIKNYIDLENDVVKSAHTGHLILFGKPIKNVKNEEEEYSHEKSITKLKRSTFDKGKISSAPIEIGNDSVYDKTVLVSAENDPSRDPFIRHIYFIRYNKPEGARHVLLNADLFLHMFPKAL